MHWQCCLAAPNTGSGVVSTLGFCKTQSARYSSDEIDDHGETGVQARTGHNDKNSNSDKTGDNEMTEMAGRRTPYLKIK
jgi:hypothetical protein